MSHWRYPFIVCAFVFDVCTKSFHSAKLTVVFLWCYNLAGILLIGSSEFSLDCSLNSFKLFCDFLSTFSSYPQIIYLFFYEFLDVRCYPQGLSFLLVIFRGIRILTSSSSWSLRYPHMIVAQHYFSRSLSLFGGLMTNHFDVFPVGLFV